MLSDEIQVFFSCKRENTQWLSTLVLNHSPVSNLNTLIAHNYKFFNDTFDNLILLDLCLKFKKGFNYRSLDCKTKNRYFSEIKYLIKDYNFTRCTRVSVISEAITYSLRFKGNTVNYFESTKECCYDKEPDCQDYIISKSLEFPYDEEMLKEVYESRKKEQNKKKTPETDLIKEMSREEMIVIINELSIADFDIENRDFKPLTFIHPLENYSPSDLTESDKADLAAAKKLVKERKDNVISTLRDIYKSRFIYTDVNHLNRPIIMKNVMDDYFSIAEEEKKKLVEGFKFYHGIRGFEIVGGEKELEEFKGSFQFLKNRMTLMGGVNENNVNAETWSEHMALLTELKQVNLKLKKLIDRMLKAKTDNADLGKRMIELEFMKYDLLLKIKALYPRWAFIEDEYLDRDTSSWKKADLCRFIKAALNYRRTSESFFTPSEKIPGRNKLSEGLGSNKIEVGDDIKKEKGYEKMKKEAENKLREVGLFIPENGEISEEQAQQLSLNLYIDSKRVYDLELERLQACAGHEIAEILSLYFVDHNKNKEKDLNYRLEKAKKDYNFMIKNRKNWSEDDHTHFLKNLEAIFEIDEDFEKYLTSDFKQDLKERIDIISREMAAVIKAANNCPKCFSEKQELMLLNQDKDKNAIRTGSEKLGMNLIKLLDSYIEMDVGITRKGNLKLKEIGETSSKGGKSKKKKTSAQDEISQAWDKNRSENSNKLIKLVNSYKRIYNSLGDSVILDPYKYGINPYHCTCDSNTNEQIHMHYRNATLRNLNIHQSKEMATLKLKEEIDRAERRIRELNTKRDNYNRFVKSCEEMQRENDEYRRKKELERSLAIEDIKRKIKSITINKSMENSTKFLDKLRENWNAVIERCSYNVNEKNKILLLKNRAMNDDFYKKLSLEKIKFFKESITKVARETNEIKSKKREDRIRRKHEEMVKLGLEKPKSVATKNKFELLYDEEETELPEGAESDDSDDDSDDEEEVLETYEDYERKWVQIANKRREEYKIKQVELIEVSNKYELMYHDDRALNYANESADVFLASSKNIRLLSDLKLRDFKNEKIRKLRDEVVNERGYCEKGLLAEIHEKCGSHFIKEYSVTNIKPILVLMFLCMVNKVPVDCKFVKRNYGMKRCQLKYIYNSIRSSMKILEKSANSKKEQSCSY